MTPAESMQSHLADLSKDFAQLVEESNERHTEVMAALKASNEGFAQLSREVMRMSSLLTNYVEETKGLRSEVREKLKLAANGSR